MASYQVIFFDAAQTLFHINGSVAEIYLQYAVRHGFRQKPTSLVSITQAFSRSFKDASPPVFAPTEPAVLKQSERLWWFDIVHNVFYRVGMFEGRYRATPARVAIAWLLAQPVVTAPIASATSPSQLAELVAAAGLQLDAAAVAQLNEASAPSVAA